MFKKRLTPDDFEPPESLETPRMRLRMLTIHDAVKDFDAVMTSAERLRTVFRPGGEWPEGLTLEQNILELAWHQVEFQNRFSFAYTVVSLDESRVLGCVYLDPSPTPDHDVVVAMWVRQSEAETGLDEHLYETVRNWIDDDWPFANPAFPGRAEAWTGFEALL